MKKCSLVLLVAALLTECLDQCQLSDCDGAQTICGIIQDWNVYLSELQSYRFNYKVVCTIEVWFLVHFKWFCSDLIN